MRASLRADDVIATYYPMHIVAISVLIYSVGSHSSPARRGSRALRHSVGRAVVADPESQTAAVHVAAGRRAVRPTPSAAPKTLDADAPGFPTG